MSWWYITTGDHGNEAHYFCLDKIEINFYFVIMLRRKTANKLKMLLGQYPAVALVGPRQVGKTTLAKSLSSCYFDLELEDEKLRLDLEWDSLVESNALVVLDEVHNDPDIFPKIRHAIDSNRKKNGRFLLLGSIAPSLMKNVSEFLTGRIAMCELTPIFVLELKTAQMDALWFYGGYPDGGILNKAQFPTWQQNYLDLMAMRDLPVWGLPAKPQVTRRLFNMLAASHGCEWNASQIGKSLGLSYHTVNTYLDFLEQTFLIRRVQPFYANLKKRLIKSPKIYWRDTGLLHYLLNTGTYDQLISQPWVGNSWEGWVIEQIMTFFNISQMSVDGPYYLRTRDGTEIDLLLIVQGELWTFEIKLTSSPKKDQLDKLMLAADLVSADKCFILSRTQRKSISERMISTHLKGFFDYCKTTLKGMSSF